MRQLEGGGIRARRMRIRRESNLSVIRVIQSLISGIRSLIKRVLGGGGGGEGSRVGRGIIGLHLLGARSFIQGDEGGSGV